MISLTKPDKSREKIIEYRNVLKVSNKSSRLKKYIFEGQNSVNGRLENKY